MLFIVRTSMVPQSQQVLMLVPLEHCLLLTVHPMTTLLRQRKRAEGLVSRHSPCVGQHVGTVRDLKLKTLQIL